MASIRAENQQLLHAPPCRKQQFYYMTSPLVSVVIPNYNNANLLKSALSSVLAQDYSNIEIIVVDDGSTDNSVDVLQQFIGRITVVQQPNQGPAAARNNGIRAARGEFIAFLDSDDLWLPGKLSAQIGYLQQHPDIALCYCGWTEHNGKTALPDMSTPLRDAAPRVRAMDLDNGSWLYLDLLRESVIHIISAVLRREVIDKVGLFNTDYLIGEDHDFWLRVSQHYKIAKLPQVYAVYRNNPQSTTKKVHAKNFSLMVLESAIARYGYFCPSGAQASRAEVNTYLGRRHFNFGYNAMLQGQRKKALSSFVGCIRHGHRLGKVLIFAAICKVPLLYRMFLTRKNAHSNQ